MAYVFEFYWLYFAIAAVFGGAIGWATWAKETAPGWFRSWAGWSAVAFAIGVAVALLRGLSGRPGLYLELALFLFALYIAGCFLGGLLRSLFAPARLDMVHRAASAPAGGGARPAGGDDPVLQTGAARQDAGKNYPDQKIAPAAPPAVTALQPGQIAGQGSEPGIETVSSANSGAILFKPPALERPAGDKADDLKRIRGIGPANEKQLNQFGIYHFHQIAAWKPENIGWVGDALSFPGRIEREDWVGQARKLAAGEATEFSRRVDAGEVPSSQDGRGAERQERPGVRPPGLAAARGSMADDLKRISGIGRQNEGHLNGLGIYHYDQIASWTAPNAEWLGDFLAFPGRIEREDWIGQAAILAAGEETDFSRRVDSGEVPTSRDDDDF